MKLINLFILATVTLFISCSNKTPSNSPQFITTSGINFINEKKPHFYLGTNYWYGPALALMEDSVRGITRLRKELDFLKEKGITNLRICAAVEGSGQIQGVPRIIPTFQTSAGVFNVNSLIGLDVVLNEIAKRKMVAVLFLSNNWEWSGGFLQYLRWNNEVSEANFINRMDWETTRDEVSKFYSCKPCIEQYKAQLTAIVTRTNSVNGIKYSEDPTIMAWQLANEPRPMRPAAIGPYKKWIADMAATIKSLDTNHLVTTGVEGYIGTENIEVFREIHSDKNIDYATIHIWPRNWAWYKDINDTTEFNKVVTLTGDYITQHCDVMRSLNKPLVLEEFGFPRDNNSFDPGSTTKQRDKFYELILSEWKRNQSENGVLAGCNFWAFGGNARPIPGQKFWKSGDDFMGDPPMEEQGLYTVFDRDSTTWSLIKKLHGF